MPTLSIVIPTIKGREEWLELTLEGFRQGTSVEYEVLVERDHAVCGTAWNAGIERAQGEYVLLAADDLHPVRRSWFDVARARADKGFLPCAVIYNDDRSLQSCGAWMTLVPDGTVSPIARIPFGTLEQMRAIHPILPIHYATDNWFSHRGLEEGWPSVVTHGMDFVHYFAPQGRIDSRVMDDVRVYWEAAGLDGEPMPAAL